jgi:hypothetical protein
MDAHDLYGLPLEGFTPERNALAKKLRAAGRADEAKAVAALRKPSIAAWAVNQLVRTQSRDVKSLFEAGDAAQQAQAALLAGRGDGPALREALDRERAAVESLARAARGLLSADGHELSPAMLQRVTDTLHAAALEPEARSKVANGCLERELRHVGLGAAGLGAAPPPSSGGRSRASAERQRTPTRTGAALRKQAAEARRVAELANRELLAAEERANAAVEALEAAKQRLAEARRRAREAEAAHRRTQRQADGH